MIAVNSIEKFEKSMLAVGAEWLKSASLAGMVVRVYFEVCHRKLIT